MEFGEKLKHARETKGITQQTLASQLFVTRQAVSRWECGARFPDLLTARKLSEYLEVSLDELLSPDETTKCIEENPIIESPTILRVQTSLYGFHGMAYFLLLVYSLYIWGCSIEDILQCPSSLIIILPTLLTRIALMFLTFWGLNFSIKEQLSPKKTAILPMFFCSTQTCFGKVVVSHLIKHVLDPMHTFVDMTLIGTKVNRKYTGVGIVGYSRLYRIYIASLFTQCHIEQTVETWATQNIV